MELKDYFKKAQKEKWAIGQFNFSTLEQLKGIFGAAKKMKSPIILGTSEGELKFLGIKEAIALVEILKSTYKVPAFLNLDHGKDAKLIKKVIDFGYEAVHFDGSSLSIEKNLKYIKKITETAHKKNIIVEGEIDEIGNKKICSLEEIMFFLEKSRVDSLAIGLNNVHGFYKNVKLNFERLKEARSKTDTFLVLHGGSGIPNSQIKKAIKLGIVKININTEIRMAWRQGVDFGLKGGEIKPYKVLPKSQEYVQKKVEEKIKLFKSYNKF